MTAERIDPEELTPSNPDGKATSAPDFYNKVIAAIDGHADLLDEYSVVGFGAIPDDATDNTAAIQAAISTVSALGGGRVYIPGGVYRTGKLTLKSNVALVGDGAISYSQNSTLGASILKLNNDTDTSLIDCNGAVGADIEGLVLLGRSASATAAVGVRLTSSRGVRINNCRITQFKGDGIYAQSNGVNRIFDCIISYNGGSGINFAFGAADSMIRNCFINANTGHGISLGSGSNMNYIIENRIEWNSSRGVNAFAAVEIQFIGNQLDRNQLCGMRLSSCNSWNVVGNRFKRNAPAEPTTVEKANVYLDTCSSSVFFANTFEKGTDDGGGGTLSPNFGFSYINCTDIKLDGNALKGSTVAGTSATEANGISGNTNVTGMRNILSDTGRAFALQENWLGNYPAGGGAVPIQLRNLQSSYGSATSANLLYLANPNDSSNNAVTKGFLFRLDKPASAASHASLVISEFRGFDSTNPITFTDASWTDGFTFAGGGKFTAVGGVQIGATGTPLTQTVVYTPTLTPSAVAASTTAEQTFTVTGLTTADTVHINPPASLGDGLGIVGVRVSAADTLAIRFANNTAGALTPASGAYRVVGIRS